MSAVATRRETIPDRTSVADVFVIFGITDRHHRRGARPRGLMQVVAAAAMGDARVVSGGTLSHAILGGAREEAPAGVHA